MSNGTRAPRTIITYPIAGQTDFSLPFEYLARKFIVATLVRADSRYTLTLGTQYRFVTATTIQVFADMAGWESLEIRRVTSASERLVDFQDGSILRASNLNLSQIQTLHVAEEARDLAADGIVANDQGILDARGRRIGNLARGVFANDAATVGQLVEFDTSTYNNALRAEQSKVEAVAAEGRAYTYAVNALAYKDEAGIQASNALQYKDTAVLAAGRAENARDTILGTEITSLENARKAESEANRATAQATIAKTEADRLVNNNAFAGTLAFVDGLDVTYKVGATQTIAKTSCDKFYAHLEFISNAVVSTFNGAIAVGSRLIADSSAVSRGSQVGGLHINSSHVDFAAHGQHIAWDSAGTAFGSTLFVNNRGNGAGGYIFQVIRPDLTVTGQVDIDGTGNLSSSGNITSGRNIVATNSVTAPTGSFSTSVAAPLVEGGTLKSNGGATIVGPLVADVVIASGNVGAGGGTDGTLWTDGSISGSAWGGQLSAYLTRGDLFFNKTVGGRIQGWTAVGTGFIELNVDGAPYAVTVAVCDERRKEYIKEHKALDSITDIFRSIKSVSYKFIDTINSDTGEIVVGHRSRFGFTTQDLQGVWPEAVNTLSDGAGAPNTTELIGGLIAMVKRLDERCVALENTIDSLQSRINNL